MTPTAERIAELCAALDDCADARLAPARELVAAVLELHGRGLAAMLAVLREQQDGEALIAALARDREAANLLLLHGLHPAPVEVRVAEAIAGFARQASVRDVEVRLVSVHEHTVRLRLAAREGSGRAARGDGVASRGIDLAEFRSALEAVVLECAPEIEAVHLENMPAAGHVAFIPLSAVQSHKHEHEHGWQR